MIQNTFGYLPEYIVADACYDSEQNYMAIIDDFNKTPLITYVMFIKDKTRKFKSDIFNTQNWKYDELNDEFICPNNKRIGFKRYAYRNDRYGFKRELGFVLMAINIRKIAAQRAVHYKIHIKKADFYQIINRNQLFTLPKNLMSQPPS
ncbi:Mobile element protein [Staphylococcus aureus]|nr:Mobile element protein [Staphylococcus aureus]